MTGYSAAANSAEADLWVARRDRGDWSPTDEAELQAWLAADPRRHGALLKAQAAWMSLDPHLAGVALPADRPPTRRRLFLSAGSALAASLVGGLAWLSAGPTYRTEIGEIRRVPLADGSVATINTDSVLDVSLAKHQRDVHLVRGEAWFQVAKDAHRPFIVRTGDIRVRAVGTAFSVRRLDAGAQVLVTEGVVETWAADASGHRVRLAAGDSAFVGGNSEIRIDRGDPARIERTLAWRSGSIDLSGQPLAEAVASFNRYNARQLVLADPRLGQEQFDGVFRTNDPQGFAAAVGSSLHRRVDLSDPSTIRIGGEGK